jgi:hypothetical protein
MSEDQLRNLLRAELESLGRAASSLQKSMAKCSRLTPSPRQSFEEEESFDALTSKFARCSDILTQKVLKTLVFMLREDAPTFLDRMNLCEKLGAIPSARSLVEIRDLRNTIAREYAVDDLMELYSDVLQLCPQLIEAARSAEDFATDRLRRE